MPTHIRRKVTAFLGYVQVPSAKIPCGFPDLSLMIRKTDAETKKQTVSEKVVCFSVGWENAYFVKMRYSHGLSVIVSFAERVFFSLQLKQLYLPS